MASKVSIIKEIWEFLVQNKKWWLFPVVIFLVLLGALLVLGGGASGAGAFIYTLF